MEKNVKLREDAKWHKSYFWDKLFPLIFAGVISFLAGYCLKFFEVRDLKKEIQSLKITESTIQSEIKEAINTRDTSKITSILEKLNR
jgi:hypothetical protein